MLAADFGEQSGSGDAKELGITVTPVSFVVGLYSF